MNAHVGPVGPAPPPPPPPSSSPLYWGMYNANRFGNADIASGSTVATNHNRAYLAALDTYAGASMFAFDLTSGNILWSTSGVLVQSAWGSAAVTIQQYGGNALSIDGLTVYGFQITPEYAIDAISTVDGSIKWSTAPKYAPLIEHAVLDINDTYAGGWAAVRDAVAADNTQTEIYMRVGPYVTPAEYFNYRSSAMFDTSVVPAGFTAVNLKLYISNAYPNADNWKILIKQDTGGVPSSPSVTSDYNRTLYTTTWTTQIDSATLVTGDWNTIPINAGDFAKFNLSGTTKVMFFTSYDTPGLTPPDDASSYADWSCDIPGNPTYLPYFEFIYGSKGGTLSGTLYGGVSIDYPTAGTPRLYAGDTVGTVYSFDGSGSIVWVNTGKSASGEFYNIYHTPTILSDHNLIVGGANYDNTACMIKKIDYTNGNTLWSISSDVNTCFNAQPVADMSGSIYVTVAGPPIFLYKYDSNGIPVWNVPSGDSGLIRSGSTPAIGDDGSVYTNGTDFICKFDRDAGSLMWFTPRISTGDQPPVLSPDGSRIYVGDGDTLVSILTASGSEEWRTSTYGQIWGNATVDDSGYIYASVGPAHPAVIKVSSSGTFVWYNNSIDPGGGSDLSLNPIIIDGCTSLPPGPPPMPDQNTTVLMHFDTDFTDRSGKVWTDSGVTIEASMSRFGAGCGLFPASATLSTPSSPDFAYGTGDYTIDFWIYFIGFVDGNQFIRKQTGGNNLSILIQPVTGGVDYPKRMRIIQAGNGYNFTLPTDEPPIDEFHHFAIVRAAGVLSVYYDGQALDAGQAAADNIPQHGVDLSYDDASLAANAYIDEYRESNVARWKSNFTPMGYEYASP